MKDEEIIKKARDIICHDCAWNGCDNNSCPTLRKIVKAIELGLAEGRKDAIRWHDLRKNPNDLPKYENSMTIRICWINPYGNKCYHDAYYDGKWFYWVSEKTCKKQYADHGVIAWCELPEFKDKE